MIKIALTKEEEKFIPLIGEDVPKEFRGRENYSLGAGTTLFIRKNLPGSAIGKGYTVEVYESGKKVDTLFEPNKQRLMNLIKKYKEFYNTDRAFHNELQLHVTYKKRPEEKEKKSMYSLDTVLNKKAVIIQDILTKLIYPDTLVKTRNAAEGIGSVEDILKEPSATKSITGDLKPDQEVDEKYIADKVINKVVNHFSKNSDKPIDTLYNSIKSWLSDLSDIIDKWNDALETDDDKIDKDNVIEKCNDIFLSGDPSKFDTDVASNVAKKIQEVFSKEIGTKEDAAKGGETTAEKEASFKYSSEEDITKFVNYMERLEENHVFSVNEMDFIKNNCTSIIDLYGTKADKTEQENKLYGMALIEKRDKNSIESLSSEFWKYASSSGVCGDIDKIFIKWASAVDGININIIETLWARVCDDVNYIFKEDRKAYFNLKGEDIVSSVSSQIAQKLIEALSKVDFNKVAENEKQSATDPNAPVDIKLVLDVVMEHIKGPENLDQLLTGIMSVLLNKSTDKFKKQTSSSSSQVFIEWLGKEAEAYGLTAPEYIAKEMMKVPVTKDIEDNVINTLKTNVSTTESIFNNYIAPVVKEVVKFVIDSVVLKTGNVVLPLLRELASKNTI